MKDHTEHDRDEEPTQEALDPERDMAGVRPREVGAVFGGDLESDLGPRIARADDENIAVAELAEVAIVARMELHYLRCQSCAGRGDARPLPACHGHNHVARLESTIGRGDDEAAVALRERIYPKSVSDLEPEARGRAYRLYKDAGDKLGAARMATWLACDELDFNGAVPVASGWLARAHRLLDPFEVGPGHGWLAFFDGYMANVDGRTAKAAELGRRSAELGRQFAVPDLEMLGLALEGAALVAAAEVEVGMRCLDEATAVALQGEAEIPISGAWACCFLVSA